MKVVTSATVFQDSVGMRLSVTYSNVDENGKITSDNVRANRVLTDMEIKNKAAELLSYAQQYVDSLPE